MGKTNELIIAILSVVLITACGDDGDDNGMPDAGEDADIDDAAMDAEADGQVADAAPDAVMDAGADAGAETFAVTLTTEAEVPVCDGAGEDAAGTATVTIAPDGSAIEVMDLEWADLSGPATAAHIHAGEPDEAGPIVLDFGADPTSPIDETFTEEDYASPPPEGAPDDFASFVEAMREGASYINVHTEECPPGEIRGQIE